MIVNLRTLTLKSKLGFGNYKHETVEKLIGMNKQESLISAYFKLGKISFNNEVLGLLDITEEYLIPKPGKDLEMYYVFLNDKGYTRRTIKRRKAIERRSEKGMNSGLGMLPKTSLSSKSKLQGKNHGRG